MDAQTLRAETFKALHERDRAFVMPNPWDAGSAVMLASLGFEALATTSAGYAFSLGRPDAEGALSLEDTLRNAAMIAKATALPVAADLENGFSDTPDGCAETLLRAAASGIVGGSIEDATGIAVDPIYPFDLSVERVEAAVAAARSLPFPFTLTARAENLLHGRLDLPDTIRRLQAYAEAGADGTQPDPRNGRQLLQQQPRQSHRVRWRLRTFGHGWSNGRLVDPCFHASSLKFGRILGRRPETGPILEWPPAS